MKCAWAAESSRMKSSVQLGLLCLSLFVSSLHGEEVVEADTSMANPINFDEPDLEQFEMNRVRRQIVSTAENTAKTVAPVPSSENSKKKGKWIRPGVLSVLGRLGNPTAVVDETHIYHRTKRQEKSRNNKRKRPGSHSILESIDLVPPPQQTDTVKRDAGGERPLPES
ncbi:hypothetical protein QQF64_015054 [Cirrhinus molitorella]|uniref:Secreted protein n=1 Tax=Cirrhinus molitorella TaxID=172907 RepID=A0ABR3NTV0_9TELE